MFSFGIEPSITSTNGASSSRRTAWRNGSRNSSPPSVGESTLLCRWTLGIPGIAPRRTSSIPGCPAAVTDTLSPSQLIPSEIQRMWTSSTAGAVDSVAIADPSIRDHDFLELQGIDQELFAADDLDGVAAARAARRRQHRKRPLGAAVAAAAGRRHGLDHELRVLELRALGHQRERELERRRHDLAQ